MKTVLTVVTSAEGGVRMLVCLARTSARSPADVRPTDRQLVPHSEVTLAYLRSSALNMIIDTFRVRHILEHDIADLQCGFSES
jgi:hypothetical protein